MGFDSLTYYFFLYGVFCLCWFWRNSLGLLLAGSLLFYASFSFPKIFILFSLATLSYFGAIFLARFRRLDLLYGLLLLNFSPLLFFKFSELTSFQWGFPLGISFFSFHCASYLIDSYRGTIPPERSFKKVLLYVSFFPQLVAGPITRAKEILPQFSSLARPSGVDVRRNVWRIYLGLFKKFTIANVAFIFASEVFTNPQNYHRYAVLLSVLLGRYFIYADFSGYTDIAIGSGRLLGIHLPENFRRPFAAPSIAEYWRRWHITLSTWIRDYIFYPLAAASGGAFGAYPLVMLTFLILGAWHGIAINFFLYGIWHGSFLILHDLTRKIRSRLWWNLGIRNGVMQNWIFPWATFFLIVCPPTILFLTKSPSAAWAVIRGVGQESGLTFVRDVKWYHLLTLELSIAILELYQWLAARMDCFSKFESLPKLFRWSAMALALIWLAMAGEFTSDLSFLYFQF